MEFHLLKNDEDGMSAKMIAPDLIDTATIFEYTSGKLTTSPNTLVSVTAQTAYPHEATWIDMIGNFDINNPTPYLGGYCPQASKTLCYDPSVNKDFIMGCTTSGEYTHTSYIKNGKSWKLDCEDISQARYVSAPYYGIQFTTGTPLVEISSNNYNENTLSNGQSTITRTPSSASTSMDVIVFLKKNDYLQLKMLQRQWINKDSYTEWNYGGTEQTDAIVDLNGRISFECFAPSDKLTVDSDYMDMNNESLFPKMLNISNFLPNDEKMSDFVNNFIKEFNLSYQQNGKTISLNKQHIDFNTKNCIDLTDRVSNTEIEMETIDFPSQMSVQYTINDEERGFYISAEKNATDEQIQSSSWKEYADRGYDIIDIMEDEYADESKVTTKTSYNWFETFRFLMIGTMKELRIPVIGKDEWYIEGYKYAEMMKNDGYNLKRRYWFPSDDAPSVQVYLNGDSSRIVNVKEVVDTYDGCNMSYKLSADDGDETLLTRYFNIFYDSGSNYIKFEAYLTTEEYISIKNGSNIIIDDDVYIPTELKGYDCSGNNPTEITAIKK